MHTLRGLALVATASLTFTGVACHPAPSGDEPNALDPSTWVWAEDPASLDLTAPDAEQPIFNGSLANQPYHDAVVSLNQRFGNQVSPSIFCTGTLIAADTVLTAGHCAVGNGPGNVAVYFGTDPTQDNNPRFVGVTDVVTHPSYSPSPNNDLAYLKLSEPVLDVTPISPLPATLGLSQSDVGSLPLEFVGFGRTEFNGGDTRLTANGTLGGLGCSVPGCGGTHSVSTQMSYSQNGGAGGPCNGDSGGPAFVTRAGVRYVGGVTSYGDQNCTFFGVSARVDTQTDFISDALDGALPPGVEDNEDPVATLVSPDSGDTLAGNGVIEVVATASDDLGLSSVQLEWDFSDESFGCPTNLGAVSCAISGDTYVWSINVGTGSRTFRLTVTDFAGNTVTTPSRTIALGDGTGNDPEPDPSDPDPSDPDPSDTVPPVVSILSPANGAELQSNSVIEVIIEATDDVALDVVELEWDFSNIALTCPTQQTAVSCAQQGTLTTWNINVGEGSRTFRARAVDAAGNVSFSSDRTISLVDDPTEQPPVEDPPDEEEPPVEDPPDEEEPPATDPPDEEEPPATDPPDDEEPPNEDPPGDDPEDPPATGQDPGEDPPSQDPGGPGSDDNTGNPIDRPLEGGGERNPPDVIDSEVMSGCSQAGTAAGSPLWMLGLVLLAGRRARRRR